MAKPKPKRPVAATLGDLFERTEQVKRVSDDLIRKMHDLASEIAETKARTEDLRSRSRGPPKIRKP